VACTDYVCIYPVLLSVVLSRDSAANAYLLASSVRLFGSQAFLCSVKLFEQLEIYLFERARLKHMLRITALTLKFVYDWTQAPVLCQYPYMLSS
jgi:hypothetical protein